MPLGSRLSSDRLTASLHLRPAAETKQKKMAVHHANKTLLSAFLLFFLLDFPCFSCSSPFASLFFLSALVLSLSLFTLSLSSPSLSLHPLSLSLFLHFVFISFIMVIFTSLCLSLFLPSGLASFGSLCFIVLFYFLYSIILVFLPLFWVCVRVSFSRFFYPQ